MTPAETDSDAARDSTGSPASSPARVGWRAWSAREKFWAAIGGLAVVSTFCVVLPVLAFQGQLSSDWLIKLLALLLSWPAAAVLIACVVVPRFQTPISAYLDRATEVKLFNASIVASRQQPAPDPVPVHAPPPANDVLLEAPPKLERPHAHESETRDWKFRYANVFLVPRSQQLLQWISQNSPTTTGSISTYWKHLAGEPEIGAMLFALKGLGLISGESTSIVVTEEGKQFLAQAPWAAMAPTPEVAPLPTIHATSTARLPLGSGSPLAPPPVSAELLRKALGLK